MSGQKRSSVSKSPKKSEKSKNGERSSASSSSARPVHGNPYYFSDANPVRIRENIRSISREQQETLARIKRLEEKLEKKRKARSGGNSTQDQELQTALDRLMKSMGDDKMI